MTAMQIIGVIAFVALALITCLVELFSYGGTAGTEQDFAWEEQDEGESTI